MTGQEASSRNPPSSNDQHQLIQALTQLTCAMQQQTEMIGALIDVIAADYVDAHELGGTFLDGTPQ